MSSDPSRSPDAAPQPTCDYCGSLGWTVEKYGMVVHKQHCPHRTDPLRHQGNPGLWASENRSAATLVKFRELMDDAVLLAVNLAEVENGDVDAFMEREYPFVLARLSEKGLIDRDD